jgi:TolB protein
MKRVVPSILLFAMLSAMLASCKAQVIFSFRITGTAQEVVVRYIDENGEVTPEKTVSLPYAREFKLDTPIRFQIYASNVSGQGDVKCEVFADHQSLGEASGTFFAGCEGTFESQGGDSEIRFTSYEDVFPETYSAPLSGILLFAGDWKSAESRNFYAVDLVRPSEAIQLSEGMKRTSACPRLSPDGTRLAFTYGGLGQGLFVINVDGSGLVNVTSDGTLGSVDFCADWSPDGNRLVFTAATEVNHDWINQVYVINADGSNLTQLTNSTSENDSYDNPSWSPDGSRIAFLSNSLVQHITVMNADGSDLTVFDQIEGIARNVRWSPDGTQLVFACHEGLDGIGERVCVVNSDGTKPARLTDDSLDRIWYTDWSPDGTKIVFIAEKDDESNLFVMNSDGTELTQVTQLEGIEPLWVSWYPPLAIPADPIQFTLDN